jgi:hypothetical protein
MSAIARLILDQYDQYDRMIAGILREDAICFGRYSDA